MFEANELVKNEKEDKVQTPINSIKSFINTVENSPKEEQNKIAFNSKTSLNKAETPKKVEKESKPLTEKEII